MAIPVTAPTMVVIVPRFIGLLLVDAVDEAKKPPV
jgi:hypothetical protein